MQWLYQARKLYGLVILNYMITFEGETVDELRKAFNN
jgi:hypothetical protein